MGYINFGSVFARGCTHLRRERLAPSPELRPIPATTTQTAKVLWRTTSHGEAERKTLLFAMLAIVGAIFCTMQLSNSGLEGLLKIRPWGREKFSRLQMEPASPITTASSAAKIVDATIDRQPFTTDQPTNLKHDVAPNHRPSQVHSGPGSVPAAQNATRAPGNVAAQPPPAPGLAPPANPGGTLGVFQTVERYRTTAVATAKSTKAITTVRTTALTLKRKARQTASTLATEAAKKAKVEAGPSSTPVPATVEGILRGKATQEAQQQQAQQMQQPQQFAQTQQIQQTQQQVQQTQQAQQISAMQTMQTTTRSTLSTQTKSLTGLASGVLGGKH